MRAERILSDEFSRLCIVIQQQDCIGKLIDTCIEQMIDANEYSQPPLSSSSIC